MGGATVISALMLLIAEFQIFPDIIWSKTVAIAVRPTNSDRCILHSIEAVQNASADPELRNQADDLT